MRAGMDALLLDVTRKLLCKVGEPSNRARDVGDPHGRRAGAGDARAAAWQALEDHGLTRAWLPEAAGGAGASLADGFAILTLAGEVALDLPLAETLLAGWSIARAGLPVPTGALALIAAAGAPIEVSPDGKLAGRAAAVPFAREAAWLAVLAERDGAPVVAVVERASCAITARDNLAGEPRDTVDFAGVAPAALAPGPAGFGDRMIAMAATARACQMAGALHGILRRTVEHAQDRVAFDKPIGKFQVIQHALARLAGETAVALAASGSAAEALATAADDDAVFLEVASAKIRVGEAATAGAAIAHQIHGAIGFSVEHALPQFTRRLWAWRDDFGSESAWAVRLGAVVARRGADALWPMLAAR